MAHVLLNWAAELDAPPLARANKNHARLPVDAAATADGQERPPSAAWTAASCAAAHSAHRRDGDKFVIDLHLIRTVPRQPSCSEGGLLLASKPGLLLARRASPGHRLLPVSCGRRVFPATFACLLRFCLALLRATLSRMSCAPDLPSPPPYSPLGAQRKRGCLPAETNARPRQSQAPQGFLEIVGRSGTRK